MVRVGDLSERALRHGALFAAVFAAGCYDLKKQDPGIELTPDEKGTVIVPAVGIQGRWYAYGDQYDVPKRCVSLGRHLPQTCSLVTSPGVLPGFATARDGAVCITGQVGAVAKCLQPQEVECLKPPTANAAATSSALGAGGAAAWDAEPLVHTWTFPRQDCSCHDPSCLPAGETCYCSPIPPLLCSGRADYPNIWGAGLGLDFALKDISKRNPLDRAAWDPAAHGVTGIAFDFSMTELPADNDALRVEFPMLLPADSRLPSLGVPPDGPDWTGTASLLKDGIYSGPNALYPDSAYNPQTGELDGEDGSVEVPSEEHPSGSPLWHDASGTTWGTDLKAGVVREGHNVIHFSEVHVPPFSQLDPSGLYDGVYTWDESKLLGIQFHVPSRSGQADAFSFCISNLTLVRD